MDWAVAFFGAIYAGAVVVPLNMVLSGAELEYQVSHSRPSVLVVCSTCRNRDYRAVARQVRDGVGDQLKVVVADEDSGTEDIVSWARLTHAAPDGVGLPSLEVADPAIMMYTSGTTGRPKGAVHTHRFISTLFDGIDRLEIRETDALLLFLPLFHIYALVAGMILMNMAGARVILMARFDAAGSLRLIQAERATIMYGIPTTYIDQLNDPAIDKTDFSSLRFVLAPLSYDLGQKVRAKLGTVCLNPYGMTETAALTAVANLDDPPEIAMRTVGRPLGIVQAKIVDETTGQRLPSDSPGVLVMRGPSIMWKYHEQPQATAEALDPDGWFSTGDLASIDGAGNITFIGRRGDGYRVGGTRGSGRGRGRRSSRTPAVLRAAALPESRTERLGQVGYAWAPGPTGVPVATEAELRDARGSPAGVVQGTSPRSVSSASCRVRHRGERQGAEVPAPPHPHLRE